MQRKITINFKGLEKPIELSLAVGDKRKTGQEYSNKFADAKDQDERVQIAIEFLSKMTNYTKEEIDSCLTDFELIDLFFTAYGDEESLTRVMKRIGNTATE